MDKDAQGAWRWAMEKLEGLKTKKHRRVHLWVLLLDNDGSYDWNWTSDLSIMSAAL